jgi:uncharacterized protein (DUF1800 family)
MGKLPAFRPTKKDPWDARKAAHLLNRAGFGGTPQDAEALVRKGLEASVQELVHFDRVLDDYPPPSWVTNPPDLPELPRPAFGQAPDPETANRRRMVGQMIARQQRQMMEETRSWWLQRMVGTARPLQEKLTLFWHGHFATEARKIRQPQLMYEQNKLFRTHAASNFKTLALEVSRDPAMLRYLDNNTNRKEHPNENFARELLELFTMGIGNYTEEDIKEAARAFTGWTFGFPGFGFGGGGMFGGAPRAPGAPGARPIFLFRRQFHDDGEKRFLGRTGNFDGEEIVNIIFEQPVTAKFLCAKLYTFFVSDDAPPPGVVEAMADLLRASKYELRPVLVALFRSEAFYRNSVIGSQIKSPVQLVAQAMRQLSATVEPSLMLNQALRPMGQVLLDPPNVKGWDSGQAWISTSTLGARYNFANFLVNGAPLGGGGPRPGFGPLFGPRGGRAQVRIDVKALVPLEARRKPEQIVDELARRLLAAPLAADQRAELIAHMKQPADDPEAQVRSLIHLMMSTPNYQLC